MDIQFNSTNHHCTNQREEKVLNSDTLKYESTIFCEDDHGSLHDNNVWEASFSSSDTTTIQTDDNSLYITQKDGQSSFEHLSVEDGTNFNSCKGGGTAACIRVGR